MLLNYRRGTVRPPSMDKIQKLFQSRKPYEAAFFQEEVKEEDEAEDSQFEHSTSNSSGSAKELV